MSWLTSSTGDAVLRAVVGHLVGGGLLFALGLGALFLFRRSSAGDRVFLGRLVFLSVALLPLAGLLPRPAALPRMGAALLEGEAPRSAALASERPEPLGGPMAEPMEPAAGVTDAAPPSRTVAPARGTTWRLLLLLWLAGVAFAAVRLVRDLLAARRLVAAARPLTGGTWAASLAALRGERAAPPVRLVSSDAVTVPMTWAPLPGRATILVPEALREAAGPRCDAILSHELAHVRRHDGVATILVRALLALHWCDPLAHWLARRLGEAAECAADDAALDAGVAASDYARELLALAPRPGQRAARGALAMARRPVLPRRLEAVLDATRRRRPARRLVRALLVVAVALLTLALGEGAAAPVVGLDQEADGDAAAVERYAAVRRRGITRLLALQDAATGAWTADVGYKLNRSYRATQRGTPHVGVTALALRCLLTPAGSRGTAEEERALARGRAWLLSVQDDAGFFGAGGTRLKSHGLALCTLARLHRVRPDEALGEALKRAVAFAIRAQNEDGGWRYVPREAGSDLLNTVAQVEGLCAARDSAIPVPARALARALEFVAGCRGKLREADAGAYAYVSAKAARVTAATNLAGWIAAVRIQRVPRGTTGADEARLRRDLEALGTRDLGDFVDDYAHYLTTELRRGFDSRGDPATRAALEAHEGRVLERLAATRTPDGGWAATNGPGEAFTTAVACLLLPR